MTQRPRIFSGMQPTGELHIGNYLGALREWVRLARTGEYDALFAIVDVHATTVEYAPAEMQRCINSRRKPTWPMRRYFFGRGEGAIVSPLSETKTRRAQ